MFDLNKRLVREQGRPIFYPRKPLLKKIKGECKIPENV